MLSPLRVWLVRHGETEWSLSGQHSGLYDLPLTAQGEEEARVVSKLLAGRRFDQVWCSPLQRAQRTCEIAGYLPHAETVSNLHEWDYGECTGFTQAQMQQRFAEWTIWDGPVPNGESIDAIAARARSVVEQLRATTGDVALFSHGHFLRIFATQFLGLPPAAGKHLALDTSAISVLGYDTGFPAILAWNVKSGALGSGL
jgi:probable phosphoglycerate mutase